MNKCYFIQMPKSAKACQNSHTIGNRVLIVPYSTSVESFHRRCFPKCRSLDEALPLCGKALPKLGPEAWYFLALCSMLPLLIPGFPRRTFSAWPFCCSTVRSFTGKRRAVVEIRAFFLPTSQTLSSLLLCLRHRHTRPSLVLASQFT